MKVVDLRSDTVTRPTLAMRRAMGAAEVGDDVLGDDPTVKRLEEMAADRFGKEAGLFVPSGTMGNQIAVAVHTRPGDEVILEADSHVFHFEGGAAAAISGVQVLPVAGEQGVLRPEDVRAAIRHQDDHLPRTALVVLENTHNMGGGRVVPLERIEAIARACRPAGVHLHLDGARIFNAVVASGTAPEAFASPFESVMFCLSKGLGAPVGSVLLGSVDFIREARRVRKRLGGGMRQVGILAAAGLVALEEGPRWLEVDHRNADRLAKGLSTLSGVRQVAPAETNIVRVELDGDAGCARRVEEVCGSQGVLLLAVGERSLRLVTHHDVDADGIERVIEVLEEALEGEFAAG